MKPFSITAPHYDDLMPLARFDHDAVANYIAGFMRIPPERIADLATGTGKMAAALHGKFPDAHIYCEDISEEMLNVLKSKYPSFEARQNSLTETEMPMPDLATIAFNSINYLSPAEIQAAIQAIRARLKATSIFYLDTLFQEEVMQRLAGSESLTREWGNEKVKATVTYTRDRIRYLYQCIGGGTEDHTQYLLQRQDFKTLLEPHFHVIDERQMDSLRTQFILKPA